MHSSSAAACGRDSRRGMENSGGDIYMRWDATAGVCGVSRVGSWECDGVRGRLGSGVDFRCGGCFGGPVGTVLQWLWAGRGGLGWFGRVKSVGGEMIGCWPVGVVVAGLGWDM